MTGLTFAKFFAADWRGGTLYQLTVDEEGMYIRSCAYMWDTGECIPGDDRLASRLLNVQIQKYQKLMGALLEKGKMTRGQGVIFNERVLEEISAFQRHSETQAKRAKAGHKTRKLTAAAVKELMEEVERLKAELAKSDTPPHQPPEVPPEVSGGGSLGGTPEVPPGVTQKKSNEINECKQSGQNSGTAEARSLEARSKNKKVLAREGQSRGRDFWAQANLEAGSYNPDEGIFRDPATGVLQLVNGKRAFWLEQFSGDEDALNLALIQAAAYVRPNGVHGIGTQVQAQLAKHVAGMKERQKRYDQAKLEPKKSPGTQSLGAQIRAYRERENAKREG